MYCMRENKSKFELFYWMYIKFLPYYFGPRLGYMLERSLKLLLHIPKRFDTFQVLKWPLIIFEVTCVIFARAANADV